MLDSNYTVKIADFGLARYVHADDEVYRVQHNKRLPVKWLSIEALSHATFSTASDVYVIQQQFWLSIHRNPQTKVLYAIIDCVFLGIPK